MNQEQEEPEESGVKLNDLPELPFEKILGYLSLEDCIKARAVSRRWYNVITSFRTKSLCYSDRQRGFFYGKNRWIRGSFAQNFIWSTKFGPFFQTFGQSILANLKHLRLFEFYLDTENTPELLAQTLNSLDQLEELVLFGIDCSDELGSRGILLHLNLPMLNSVHLKEVYGIEQVTLDAPRLQTAKVVTCFALRLVILDGELIEKLIFENLDKLAVKSLKNLKYLYSAGYSKIDLTVLLSSLEQLKEIHLNNVRNVEDLFEKNKRYSHANLKIFYRGYLLNGPSDPATFSPAFYLPAENLRFLAENHLRIAEEMPFCQYIVYSTIEEVAPGSEIDLLNKFTNLMYIIVNTPAQDIGRFLELLKNVDNITVLKFIDELDRPQQLFDRLPEHCTIECLHLDKAPADLNFLLRLKGLIHLFLWFGIDIEFARKVLEELPFLSWFKFVLQYRNRWGVAEIRIVRLKQIKVSLVETNGNGREVTIVSGVNAALQWILERA